MAIPKTIHYCWFGHGKKSKVIEKCIESWRRIAPEYTIKEWNEDNFDITCCLYVQQAYDNKKYAFVSDYARHKVLYEEGGVYLDTDVELVKSLNDLLESEFCGFESNKSVATGLIYGANSGSWLCKAMLAQYEQDSFINQDGSKNLYTVCDRTTDILVQKGLKLNDTTQVIDGVVVYNTEYFNPYNMSTGRIKVKENTYSIHHYAASWVSNKDKIRGKIYRMIARVFGVKFANKIRKMLTGKE